MRTIGFKLWSLKKWNKNFLQKTLGKLIPTLKKDGILAVNIADVYSAKDKDYFDICNPMNDFLISNGYPFCEQKEYP